MQTSVFLFCFITLRRSISDYSCSLVSNPFFRFVVPLIVLDSFFFEAGVFYLESYDDWHI